MYLICELYSSEWSLVIYVGALGPWGVNTLDPLLDP